MNKLKEFLRLIEQGCSYREIARVLDISRGSVENYSATFKKNNLKYRDVVNLTDEQLEEILSIGGKVLNSKETYQKLLSKFPNYSCELKKTGVTLRLLWEEYKTENTDGYGYSQFCFHYQQWNEMKKVSMHIDHKYGDKMFVDFSGDKLKILNPQTGIETEVEVFVSILGGSNLTYAEAVLSQKKEDFIRVTENSLLYFGGVPAAIVPDCLKSAVTKGNKYEPEINPDYADFARHYDTVILPARPYHPKDKSPVENAVRLVYQRVFAPLRNRIFTSLEELNIAVKEHLEIHNKKLMHKTNLSRRDLFEMYERNTLKPLPIRKYDFKKFSTATVQINYHIYLKEDGHCYSVPYRFKGNKISIIYTDRFVEIFYRNERIATHERKRGSGYSTNKEHMPSHHKFYAEWSPEKILSWATNIGDKVKSVANYILSSSQHPEQGFKSCIGIINLSKKYGNIRVNHACQIAITYQEFSYRFINSLLERGMDKIESEQQDLPFNTPIHENIRGDEYYKKIYGELK
jgi:transposase